MGRRSLYWVSEHDLGDQAGVGVLNCGQVMDNVDEDTILDGFPAPDCPIRCPIPNHRMRPVTRAEYVAIMGEQD